MLSNALDFAYGDHSAADSKFDSEYMSSILCTPAMSGVMKTLPADVLILDIGLNDTRITVKTDEDNTFVFDQVMCQADPKSILQMLGQIHLHGMLS